MASVINLNKMKRIFVDIYLILVDKNNTTLTKSIM